MICIKIPTLLLAGLIFSLIPIANAAEPVNQLQALRDAEKLSEAKKWPEAAAAWQRIVEANPPLGRAWLKLGWARYQAKDYRQAIEAYDTALELRSGYPFNAAYNIACCHALLGEKDQALGWLEKALKLGYRNLGHARSDEDLRSLHADQRFKKLTAMADVSRLSRDDGWRFDLDLLVNEVKRTHYTLRKGGCQEFEDTARQLRDNIPKMTDNQIKVGFMGLLRKVGDGHTGIGWLMHDQAKNCVPVEFYVFREGSFITRAHPEHADLAGAQVLKIGGHAVDEVVTALRQIVARDNDMGVLWIGPDLLRHPWILNGLGLIAGSTALPLTVRDAKGKERDVNLPADSGKPEPSWVWAPKEGDAPEPLYLKNKNRAYWFEYLPDKKMVFCQYNHVWEEGEKESIEKFCGRLFRFIEQNDVERLVIDMRWNGGGNNFLNEPLVHGLIRCDEVNREGKLFVIVGRNTFSAAMCCAAQIERETKATFVGEPTGSSPNFVGESAVIVHLPYSKLRASVSDLYWQNSVAMDYRTWIAPEIYAPPTFAAFRANRDRALEAILACEAPKEAARRQTITPLVVPASAGPAALNTAYTITTVAGNGQSGFAGDGGPATAARLKGPSAVAIDREANLYIADALDHRIRKVSPDGIITTFAGTGQAGFAGDGGPATKAKLNVPYGVSVDRQGNVYVADQQNHRIRKITGDGIISTAAGNGKRAFAGDGGPAVSASLIGPDATVSDDQGTLYIADSGNNRVRKVTADGIISTIAGTSQGYSGDGSPAAKACLNHPAALALDQSGNLYIGDFRNHVIRRLTTDGLIHTVAGTGKAGFNGDGIPAVKAQLNQPGGVAVTSEGLLVVADGVNFRVRSVGSDGLIHTIAGTGRRGDSGDGGPATKADLSVLDILTIDAHGNIYVSDFRSHRIRKLTPIR